MVYMSVIIGMASYFQMDWNLGDLA